MQPQKYMTKSLFTENWGNFSFFMDLPYFYFELLDTEFIAGK